MDHKNNERTEDIFTSELTTEASEEERDSTMMVEKRPDLDISTDSSADGENIRAGSVRASKIRWVVLMLVCFYTIGSPYSFDIPAALSPFLLDPKAEFHITPSQYNVLLNLYAMPNMIMPLIGGIIMDKIGVKAGILLFGTILTTGQFIFTIGGISQSFTVMAIGRGIFGIAGDCIYICQYLVLCTWFKGKELNLAFGCAASAIAVCAVVNAFVEPAVATQYGLGAALWVGCGVSVFALTSGLLLACIDHYADKMDGSAAGETAEEEKFKCKQLLTLGLPFWLMLLAGSTIYSTFYPYVFNSATMLTVSFGISPTLAANCFCIPYVITGLTSPLFGMWIDRVGHRALFLLAPQILGIVGYALTAVLIAQDFTSTNWSFLAPYFILGLAFSIYLTIHIAIIPFAVKPEFVGTACGVAQSLSNIGLAIIPQILGSILTSYSEGANQRIGYLYVQFMLCGIVVVGTMIGLWLYCDDIKNRGGQLDAHNKDDAPTLAASRVMMSKSVSESPLWSKSRGSISKV